MASTLEQLLVLEKLDTNLFRSRHHKENFRKTLYGGQVLSQALAATFASVDDDKRPNSLHAYFLRAGLSDTPVIYDVENVRDGKSLSSRRAVARQNGRPIFNMGASFHKLETGYQHQANGPQNVPTPEELITEKKQSDLGSHIPNENDGASSSFDLLAVNDTLFSNSGKENEAESLFWMKTSKTLPEDPLYHYCALAFGSDFGLLATSLLPHEASLFDAKVFAASIDHAMWFHHSDFRADDWLLCHTSSPWAGNARGFARANIYNRKNELVASTAQEGLIRPI